jgi:hypothetical protein
MFPSLELELLKLFGRSLLMVIMEISKDQFDRAFAEFQETGPRREIRIEDRWREIMFDVHWRDYAAIRERCEQIEGFAFGLAKQVRDQQKTNDQARDELAQAYPFLTSERLARTWSQAMSFAMK